MPDDLYTFHGRLYPTKKDAEVAWLLRHHDTGQILAGVVLGALVPDKPFCPKCGGAQFATNRCFLCHCRERKKEVANV